MKKMKNREKRRINMNVSCKNCRFAGINGEQKIVCPNEELCVKKPITQEERREDVPLYQRACYLPL